MAEMVNRVILLGASTPSTEPLFNRYDREWHQDEAALIQFNPNYPPGSPEDENFLVSKVAEAAGTEPEKLKWSHGSQVIGEGVSIVEELFVQFIGGTASGLTVIGIAEVIHRAIERKKHVTIPRMEGVREGIAADTAASHFARFLYEYFGVSYHDNPTLVNIEAGINGWQIRYVNENYAFVGVVSNSGKLVYAKRMPISEN